MYCKNCGSYLDPEDSANFCSNCGFDISNKTTDKVIFVNQGDSNNSAPVMKNGVSISQLKSYSQIIGVFEILIGAFLFFGSMLLFLIRSYAIKNVSMMEVRSVRSFYLSMNILVILGIFLVLFGIFVFISGIGLLKGKKWSKITSMIVGALSIFSFPLGTLFGVFTLYYLSNPEMSQVLTN